MQQAKEDERRKQREGNRIGKDETRSGGLEKARLMGLESRSSLNEDGPQYASSLNEAEQALTTAQPIMSPTTTTAPLQPSPPSSGNPDHENNEGVITDSQTLSEKARGKRREQQTHMMTSSLEHVAATGVGRNGFVPTEDWVESWHQRLVF